MTKRSTRRRRSIALNPNFADGLIALGVILHYIGRSAEALRFFERAMALNPLCPGHVAVGKDRGPIGRRVPAGWKCVL